MGLPRFVVIKSNYNNKWLRYIKEDVEVHGFNKFSAEEVLSPYAKYEVQAAKCGKGLVHIRSCYNNKYWRRWSDHHYWIVAAGDEPEEDTSKWTCTLFEPIYLWHVRFRHVQLNHYGCLWVLGQENEYDSCLFAGDRSPNSYDLDLYTIIDWESLFILPKHVAFKGDNGNYLKAASLLDIEFKGREGHHPHLQFASSSTSTSTQIGDIPAAACNQVFIARNGSVRIKSDQLGKFWRRCSPDQPDGPNWIWADSDDDPTDHHPTDLNTMFWPIKVSNNMVALRNLGNSNFCSRSRLTTTSNNTQQGKGKDKGKGKKTSCLKAAVPTMSRKAHLQVEELVSSRNIYDFEYHIKDARIYNQSILTLATGYAVNKTTQNPKTIEVKLRYIDKMSSTWNANINPLKLGVKTNIKTGGVPLITGDENEKIKISTTTEFTGEYQWGNTKEFAKEVETSCTVNDVPPRSKVKVSLVAKKASCDVPFSYSQRDTLKSNGQPVTYTKEDGIYTCINFFNCETNQEKL